MKFRTKKTVADGFASHIVNGDTQVIDYQPGNGTRYPVMLTKLTDAQSHLFGYGNGCVLVTVARFYPDRFISQPFYTDGRTIFSNEVKLAFEFQGFNDACCVVELLGELLGCPTDATDIADEVCAAMTHPEEYKAAQARKFTD